MLATTCNKSCAEWKDAVCCCAFLCSAVHFCALAEYERREYLLSIIVLITLFTLYMAFLTLHILQFLYDRITITLWCI